MGLFWFIVIIVVVIILVRKKNANTSDEYQQGYYDGYKALSEKIWHELDQPRLNHDAVKSMLIERQLQGEAVSEFESALGDSESEDTLGVAYDESGYQPYDDDVKIAAAGVTQVSRSAPEAVSPEVTSLRNLNIILYVASFLLVAAGALFIGAAVPDGVKLIGVWAIVGVFYGAGYVLHRMVARLQPAAVAFLGTGLALIPFAGFALNQYGVMNPDIVWIITSVVGVAAYMAAAVRLQSQLVSYLTVAFALSLVSSSSVSLEMSLVWQFVVFIGVSLVASLIAMVKPQWVPSVFGRPIERMGQFLTPIVLVASLFAGDQIKLAGYEILFTVSTMYYVIVWLQTRSPAYEVVVRIVASLTLTVFAFDIFDGFGSAFALSILMIAALQILYSLYVVDRPDRQGVEYRWITFMTALQLIALLTWVGGGQKEAMYGLIGLLFVGIMNIAVVLRIRQAAAVLVAVGVLVLIPFVVARGIFIPNLPDWTVIAWLMSCAIAALVAYHLYRHHSRVVRRVLTFSYILYSGLAWLVMLDANSVQTTAITLFGLAGFGLAVSYVVRMPYLQLLFSTFVVFAVVTLAQWWSIDLSWRALFVGGTVALVCWVLSFVQVVVVQLSRARISIGSGQVALLIVLGAYMSFAHNFEVTVAVGTLLLAAIVSVGLRALWRIDAATSRMFIWSYTTYAVMAVAGAALIDTALCALVAAVALVLSLVVSYIERLPVVQLASAGLTIVFVAAMADSLNVASGWQLLTTFGVSSLLLYAGALVHASYGQLARRTVMVATGQATLLMMVFAGTSANHVAVKIAFVTMVVASIGSLLLYWRSRDSQSPLKLIWMYSYVLYFVAGLMVSAALAPVWGIAALLMGSVLFWLASYAERSSFIMAIGNAVFVMALVRLWGWMEYSELWMIFGVGWTAAGLFYGVGWLIAAGGDTARRRIMLLSTWIVLATVTLIGAGIATMEIATAATLGVLAVTVGVDAYVKRKFGLVEAMVHVLTFSLQRIVSEVYPDLNAVAYAHWWAVVIVVIALLRHQYKRRRLITATAIVTAATGVYAIIYGGNYQLLFLVEHIALLIAGALTARSWATWWGVGAVALSVLYFLRGYTFVLLGLLGLMMIGIVVWRLLRSDRSNPNQHQ